MADIDFDDFLEDISSPSKPSASANIDGTATTTIAPPTPSSKQIEDELFELLNTPNDALLLTTKLTTGTTASSGPVPFEDTNDFLSWLEESPSKTPASFVQPAAALDLDNILGDSTPAAALPEPAFFTDEHHVDVPSSPLVSDSIEPPAIESAATVQDSFMLDVFGVDQSGPASPLVKQSRMSTTQCSDRIETALSSPFPDLSQLRQDLDEAGFIPAHQRAQVLLLMLTGSTLHDEEAARFIATDAELYVDLCHDLVAHLKGAVYTPPEALIQDMKDVVILYMQRRNVEYKDDYVYLLTSIYLHSPSYIHTPKAVSSSVFYSLATSFVPLVGLQYTALETAVDAVHRYVYLLSKYHAPQLCAHFDKVLPGWYKPTTSLKPHEASKQREYLAGTKGLDLLENELLGIQGLDDDASGNHAGAVPEQLGVIPTNLITTFLAPILPAPEAAKLLDWAVFNGERYAGLYFVVSLLVLHTPALVKMNAPQLKHWFEALLVPKGDWYKQFKVSPAEAPQTAHVPSAPVDCTADGIHWGVFTRAWIQATAVLMGSTPMPFRESLSRVETWAVLQAEQQRAALSKQLLAMGDGGGDEDLFDKGKDEEWESDSDASLSSTDDKLAGGETNLLSMVKAIGLKWQGKSAHATEESSVDDHTYDDRPCIYSGAEDVVPCVTSSRRLYSAPDAYVHDLGTAFCASVLKSADCALRFSPSMPESVDNEGCIFFLSRCIYSFTYFGVDTRSTEERALGLLPKAFVDDSVGDGLIEVLRSLPATTHICVIGAGEDFYRLEYAKKHHKRFRRHKHDPAHLRAYLEERGQRVRTVAMQLIAKGFAHVSVLDGGFLSAAKHIADPANKLTLETALVDIQQRAHLYALLGLPMPATASANKRASISALLSDGKSAVSSLLSTWAAAGTTPPAAPHSALDAEPLAPPAPVGVAAAAAASAAEGAGNRLLSGWGRLTMLGTQSLDSFRKVVTTAAPASTQVSASSLASAPAAREDKRSGFAIDDEDDGLGPRVVQDTTGVNISRTDAERAQALAMHRMSGLKKGDTVVISRAELPGSVLFPAHKVKAVALSEEDVAKQLAAHSGGADPIVRRSRDVELPRYLVISRERFLVLDARGGGVGSSAVVKSNRHLTELAKLTFRKKDAELVTLHYLAGAELKPSQYRVKKYKDFSAALQKNMERFK